MANRFWVGGSGTWGAGGSTSNWSDTSGGGGGFSVPSSADDVFFDAASGAGSVTSQNNALCRNLTTTGSSVTFNSGSFGNLDCYGSVVLDGSKNLWTGGTWSLNLKSTTTGQTITTNGAVINFLTFSGVGGGWTLQDAVTTYASFSHTDGTLDLNGKAVTTGSGGFGGFSSSGSNTRTLTMGASTVTSPGFSVTSTGMTFSGASSTVILAGTSGSFAGGGFTYGTVNFTATADSSISDSNTIGTLSMNGVAGYYTLTISGTQTVTAALTLAGGNATTQRLLVSGGQITDNGTISLSNVDFAGFTGAGTATWTGTSIGDGTGNTGITTTTPVTRYWVHGASASYNFFGDGRWSASSGGAVGASEPLIQDTVIFDSSSFGSSGKTVTINAITSLRMPASITATTVTNNPTWDMGSVFGVVYYGGLSLPSGFTVTHTASSAIFNGAGNYTMSFGTGTFTGGTTFSGTGTYTMGGPLTTDGLLTFSNGTLNFGNFVHTMLRFNSNNSNVRTLNLGGSTLVVTGINVSNQLWNMTTTTNLTFIAGTSTIKFTNSSASTKTFTGGGLKYYNFWIATGSTGFVRIASDNTFNEFKSDPGRNITFNPGTTQTAQNWNLKGTAGNVITIISNSPGTPFNMVKLRGQVNADYLSLTDSNATGGAAFYAGSNSTSVSGNTGWVFSEGIGGVSNSTLRPHAFSPGRAR